MQVTARKSVHVKKEQPENVVENEQVPQDKASNSTLNSCTASLDGSGEKYAPWYHGPLSRTDAEKLILKDGDFLVRESTSIHGQVVLSSMHKGKHEHLLMIDPTDGNVRDMQGKVYPTVHDFIEHHCLNGQQVQFNNNLFLRLSMPVFSTNSLTLKKWPVCGSFTEKVDNFQCVRELKLFLIYNCQRVGSECPNNWLEAIDYQVLCFKLFVF